MNSLVISPNLGSPALSTVSCINGRSSNCSISLGLQRPDSLLRLRCSDGLGMAMAIALALASFSSHRRKGSEVVVARRPVADQRGGGDKAVLVGRGRNASEKAPPGSSVRMNEVLDIVDKKRSGRSSIDPAEAKLGKVDFVRVQNWGSEGEDSPKLEELKIKSFSRQRLPLKTTVMPPSMRNLSTDCSFWSPREK